MAHYGPITDQLHHVCQTYDTLFRHTIQSPVLSWMTEQIQLQRSVPVKQPRCAVLILTIILPPACHSEFTVHWQPNVFELWLDTPTQCTQSTSFIRQPGATNAEWKSWTGCDSNSRWTVCQTEHLKDIYRFFCNPTTNKIFTQDGHSLFALPYKKSKPRGNFSHTLPLSATMPVVQTTEPLLSSSSSNTYVFFSGRHFSAAY